MAVQVFHDREWAFSHWVLNGNAVKPIGQELVKVIEMAAPIIDKHVKHLG